MVFVKEGHPKSRPIEITYYVTPHEFWFKYKEDDDDESVEDERMQERMQHLADRSKSHRNDAPKVGDIVIVQCLFMNSKYIRARVDYELKYAHGSELILWAIDYGFPIRSNPKFVSRVTSDELKKDNLRVFKGTCSGVVPAQPDYDYYQFKTVMRNKPSWSEKAINEFEKIYSNSEELTFHYKCNVAEQHVYGSLEVLLSSEKSVNMDDVLKNIDEAIDAVDFETEYESLAHKDYWLQQENYKILENVDASRAETVKALKPKNSRDKDIVNKVNDWNDRPMRMASKTTNIHSSSNIDSSSNTDPLSNTESSSNVDPSSPKMKDLPLNKRYGHCSKQDTPTSSGISKPKSTEKDELVKRLPVPESSFSSDKHGNTVPKSHFRKVIETESSQSSAAPNRVLTHCRIGLPTPAVSSIAEVHFTDVVHANLKKMSITSVYRTQSVAWPHLLRGHSLIVINAAKTGKTLTYLPAVCSLAMEYETVVDGDGPVAIIICLDSSAVTTVRKNCEDMLKGSGISVKSFSLHDDENVQKCHMLNGMDILVTSIPNLLTLINSTLRIFNAKRLKRVVFDEIDSMYQRFGEQSVHKIYNSLCNPVPDKQFILTSKIWHNSLKKFCGKDDLMLCIGAYVEAAIYSNISLTVQSTNGRDHYKQFLDNFRKGKYLEEQTVIVCNKSEEVRSIQKNLTSLGYADVTYCSDGDDSEKFVSINRAISRNKSVPLGVVVCTDETLADLRIRHAQHIIHYSLPNNWTTFNQRFVASFDYYENMVGDVSVEFAPGQPTSVVFVDELSSDAMPRLVDFMKTRCFANVPEHVSTWANIKRIEQVAQNKNYVPFCNRMTLFGVCDTPYTCTGRHFLTEADRAPEHLPRNGKVKFEIMTVHSPAHFTVRLLAHRSSARNEWQKLNLNDASTLRLRLAKHFENPENLIVYHSPKLGDLCVTEDEDEGEKYKRCQVIFIDEKTKAKMVWQIDTNVIEKCLKSQPLYVLPDEFKCYPPQAVDIRIAGVVPLDLSATWDKCLTPRARQWCDLKKNCHFEATIKMTLMKCIWVKSIEIVEKLSSIDEELVKFDFKKEIIRESLGYPDENAFPMLRDMAEKSGLIDIEPLDIKPLDNKPLDNKPLDNKPLDVVPLNKPSDIVPPAKEPLVNEREILRTPVQQLANNQERGRGRGKFLSESPGAISRSPTNIQSPALNCQSPILSHPILNGSTANEHLNHQRPTASPRIVSKPVKPWAELTPGKYIEVDIGEFYSPDRIYVLLAGEFECFHQLRQEIFDFTDEPSNLKPLINVEVGTLCLALGENDEDGYNNDYRRAKILHVNESTVNIFLVDYGVEERNVPLDDLIEIPEKFITCLPFQAILCNMIGVRPSSQMSLDESCQNIYDTLRDSRSLFVWCAESRLVSNDPMECNSYDAVFLDKDLEKNINQFVVKSGFADYDPETEHLADIEVDWYDLQYANEDWDAYHQLDDFMESLIQSGNDHQRPGILDSAEESDEMRSTAATLHSAEESDEMRSTATAMPDLIPRTTVDSDGPFTGAPSQSAINCRLESTAEMPYITWRQTESIVQLAISAPEVQDYSLKVGSRFVQFCFLSNEKRYESIVSLFGCVDAKYTSHEVRGLNIVIRLMKTLAAEQWPRLEKWPGRNQFIKCVDECYDSNEDSDTEQRKFLPLASDLSSSEDDDGDDADEDVLNSIEM